MAVSYTHLDVYKRQPVDGAGRPFSHWEFAIGSVKGLGDTVHQREVSFTMPDSNLVLGAVYQREASPSNAEVVYEVRGGSRGELALDPDAVQDLEDELTTDADQELMQVNRADVTYKVVYRKNGVKASESNAIKAVSYTHLDVYKRQRERTARCSPKPGWIIRR